MTEKIGQLQKLTSWKRSLGQLFRDIAAFAVGPHD